MRLISKNIIYCSILLIFFTQCKTEPDKNEPTGETTKIDSAKAMASIHIKRFPLPLAPAVKQKLNAYKNRVKNSLLWELLQQKTRIADSIHTVSVSDTIYPPVKSARLKALTSQSIILDETIAAVITSECGNTNDCVDVELYAGTPEVPKSFVDRFSPSIGMLGWKKNLPAILAPSGIDPGNVSDNSWGTGALISDEYFITAGHCFDTAASQGWILPSRKGAVLPSAQLAKLMQVTFNYQKNKLTTLVSKDSVSYEIDSLMEYRFGDLDYAIVRLKKGKDNKLPGKHFGKLPVSKKNVVVDETLCIIEHPMGEPKQLETGPASLSQMPYLQYFDIDTYDQSSGSPVLSVHLNALVGVHVAGGCDPDRSDCNKATAVESIVVSSPIIKKLAR